jgi:hypothetical protein
MNIIFHTTAAIGITVLFAETKDRPLKTKKAFETSVLAFLVAVISHGALDYTPHCYPINSKIDVILSLMIMITTTSFIHKQYRLIAGLSFLGSIFPDLVDLLPSILNKQLGFNLPILNKVFPWHWHEYSGSIYGGDCRVSTFNHALLVLIVGVICWYKRLIFNKNP